MKVNSIERDIHLLESYAGMTHKMNDNQGRPKLDQAIEHILSDYKRVLKENEILKDKLLDTLEGQKVIKEETPQYIKENYIPIQKIKDKVEELNDVSNAKELEDTMDGKNYTITELVQYVLQELLESEE